jgi:hypothetical protein
MRLAPALLLAALLAAPAARAEPSAADAKTLTQLLTVAASKTERAEVLSAEDVRNLVELEAEKAAAGCSDDASCLAEVAGALGARLVVFGQLGTLDEELVLTLSLFDAEDARATGRELVRGATVSELGDAAAALVPQMIEAALGSAPEDTPAPEGAERPKVLVMDLALAQTEAIAEPAGTNLLLVGGGGVAAAGLLLATAGAFAFVPALFAHQEAVLSTTPQTKAVEAIAARDTWTWVALITGGLGLGVAVVGGGVLGVGIVGGE